MKYTPIELFVGLASLFIFFYRIIVLMIPMLIASYEKQNLGDSLKALTLLV